MIDAVLGEIIHAGCGFDKGHFYVEADAEIYNYKTIEWLAEYVQRSIEYVQENFAEYRSAKYIVKTYKKDDGKYGLKIEIHNGNKIKVVTMKNGILKLNMNGGD